LGLAWHSCCCSSASMHTLILLSRLALQPLVCIVGSRQCACVLLHVLQLCAAVYMWSFVCTGASGALHSLRVCVCALVVREALRPTSVHESVSVHAPCVGVVTLLEQVWHACSFFCRCVLTYGTSVVVCNACWQSVKHSGCSYLFGARAHHTFGVRAHHTFGVQAHHT
jgi:hypothetical protein